MIKKKGILLTIYWPIVWPALLTENTLNNVLVMNFKKLDNMLCSATELNKSHRNKTQIMQQEYIDYTNIMYYTKGTCLKSIWKIEIYCQTASFGIIMELFSHEGYFHNANCTQVWQQRNYYNLLLILVTHTKIIHYMNHTLYMQRVAGTAHLYENTLREANVLTNKDKSFK
jgi:hypothetical protein